MSKMGSRDAERYGRREIFRDGELKKAAGFSL